MPVTGARPAVRDRARPQLTISVTPDIDDRVRQLARVEDLPLSRVVTRLIRRGLELEVTTTT